MLNTLRFLSLYFTTLATFGLLSLSSNSYAEEVRFDRDIRPILANHCFKCHGRSEVDRKAKLRLDQFESAKRVLFKGDRKQSELLLRVQSLDSDLRMPPPDTGPPLTPNEIAKLEAWIQQGATYSKHWAFIPPKKPRVPEVKDPSWTLNPIDRFVLARLEEKGLVPSPPATRRVFSRRLSFELRGLPPSPEEVQAFVQDADPAAKQKLIERYLNSPQFGERLAQIWLDLARYADTTGHAADKPRTMWLYRDWVIRALNENQPFDQFTIDQLAGDLLRTASESQKIATGFHRNSMQALGNNPRKEEFRIKGIVDRLDTTGKTWLGLTVACSECHDHKYDPLSQEEYYQLFAIFNNIPHYGQKFDVRGPQLKVLSLEQREEWDRYQREIDQALRMIQSMFSTDSSDIKSVWNDGQLDLFRLNEEWMFQTAISGDELRSVADTPGNKGKSIHFDGIAKSIYTIPFHLGGPHAFTLSVWVKTKSGVSDIISTYDWQGKQRGFVLGIGGQKEKGYRRGHPYVWISQTTDPFSGMELESSKRIDDGIWHHLAFVFEPGKRAQLYVDGDLDHNAKVKGVVPTSLATSNRRLALGGGYKNNLVPQAHLYRGWLHDLRIHSQALNQIEDQAVRDLETEPANKLTVGLEKDQQRSRINIFRLSLKSKYRQVEEVIRKLRLKQAEVEKKGHTAQVMAEGAIPRETYVHVRGNFEHKGKRVYPGFPKFIRNLSKKKTPNRLDFADWLTHPDHPLMARVTVNRIWAQYFGQGIVRTLDDFGTRGDVPSHPKLLDWLALELIQSGWNVKSLHRLIVSSATYRQSSVIRDDLQAIDPQNRWLARYSRRRLQAEQIRDFVLSAGGLLSLKMGGPSVFPQQPSKVGEFRDATAGQWRISQGEDRYRRSLYTFWQRMSPYPSLIAFDAPSRERSCAQRSTTNTPLQALSLLNDPIFVEAAEACAQRVTKEFLDSKERIRFAFALILSREPDREEMAYSLSFLKQWGGVEQNFSLKGWRLLCQVLFNLDEAITSE